MSLTRLSLSGNWLVTSRLGTEKTITFFTVFTVWNGNICHDHFYMVFSCCKCLAKKESVPLMNKYWRSRSEISIHTKVNFCAKSKIKFFVSIITHWQSVHKFLALCVWQIPCFLSLTCRVPIVTVEILLVQSNPITSCLLLALKAARVYRCCHELRCLLLSPFFCCFYWRPRSFLVGFPLAVEKPSSASHWLLRSHHRPPIGCWEAINGLPLAVEKPSLGS